MKTSPMAARCCSLGLCLSVEQNLFTLRLRCDRDTLFTLSNYHVLSAERSYTIKQLSVYTNVSQQHRQIKHRRIWTPPAPFLYNQHSSCHISSGSAPSPLRSKYLEVEPDSSPHQEPSFCSGFSQSSHDLFVSANDLDTVMHCRSHCCS